jgi:hypothetical protein
MQRIMAGRFVSLLPAEAAAYSSSDQNGETKYLSWPPVHPGGLDRVVEALIWLFSLAFGRAPPVGCCGMDSDRTLHACWWRLRP